MKTLLAIVAAAGMSLASGAYAATFKVEVWDIPGNGIVADLTTAEGFGPPASADAIYATDNIAFGIGDISNGTGWAIGNPDMTVQTFLDGNDASGASFVSGNSGLTIERTLMRITGAALFENGKSYALLSDDGYDLSIGGTQITRVEGRQAPGGLNGNGGAEFFTFGQATGVYDIELLWFEGQDTQVQLVFAEADGTNLVPAPVPLPAAGFLLIGALGGLAAVKRRRKAA